MAEDRQLSESEWASVEKQIAAVQEQRAMEELGRMLITQKEVMASQRKQIRDLHLQVKILEQLNTDRQEKMLALEHTLELLEKEVLTLRCQTKKSK